jgi:hypothetical protein
MAAQAIRDGIRRHGINRHRASSAIAPTPEPAAAPTRQTPPAASARATGRCHTASDPDDRRTTIERAPIGGSDVDVKQLGAPQQAWWRVRAAHTRSSAALDTG